MEIMERSMDYMNGGTKINIETVALKHMHNLR